VQPKGKAGGLVQIGRENSFPIKNILHPRYNKAKQSPEQRE